MKEGYAKETENSIKSTETVKKHDDKKIRYAELKPGDRVLVRNLSERGRSGTCSSGKERRNTSGKT